MRMDWSVAKSRTGQTHLPGPMYFWHHSSTSTVSTNFRTLRSIIISNASFSTR